MNYYRMFQVPRRKSSTGSDVDEHRKFYGESRLTVSRSGCGVVLITLLKSYYCIALYFEALN